MISFNKPFEVENFVIDKNKLSGDGQFTLKVHQWLLSNTNTKKPLLTTSCTHALELSALLLDIKPGDEVIAPSYTFVSTVNAYVLRGATIVFIDIRPDTMNIDENLIESAITEKTKAIIPVHYAGVSCEMETINAIAEKYNLFVVEDAAQGVKATYKGNALGTIGDLGTYSFHDTKNYTMGEGGALLIQNKKFIERAEILREKGTDRSKFLRGQVDKYSWVDIGSSYLPSDINAAYLYPQLKMADKINKERLHTWNLYYNGLRKLKNSGSLELPTIPDECEHNAHMFYIKCKNIDERSNLIEYLKSKNIQTAFHYIPLHTSKAGKKYGRFHGKDVYTTKESERLLRLPLYYGIDEKDVLKVVHSIIEFYE